MHTPDLAHGGWPMGSQCPFQHTLDRGHLRLSGGRRGQGRRDSFWLLFSSVWKCGFPQARVFYIHVFVCTCISHTYTGVYTHASRTRTYARERTYTFPPCVHMRCTDRSHTCSPVVHAVARMLTHLYAGVCVHTHTQAQKCMHTRRLHTRMHTHRLHTHRCMHTRVAHAGHTHTSGFSASSFLSADKMQSTLCLIKN